MTIDELTAKIDAGLIDLPYLVRPGLRRYLIDGQPVGHFLTALLANDLAETVWRADPDNLLLLKDFMLFLKWHAHSDSYGTPEKVTAWKKQGGLKPYSIAVDSAGRRGGTSAEPESEPSPTQEQQEIQRDLDYEDR